MLMNQNNNSWALPAATLGVNLIGQGLNAWNTGKQNRESREFSEWMFWQQRKHNLADWHMQNAYNSPIQQMERLKEANLNPYLVYGSGSADAVSKTQPRSADAPRPNFEPVQFDPNGLAIQALTARKIQADIARTQADTDRINQESAKKRMENQVFEANLDSLKDSLFHKYNADQVAEINRLARETAFREETGGSIEAPDHVLRKIVRAGFSRVQVDLQNAISSGDLRRAELKLKEYSLRLIDQGLPPDSPWFWKAISDALQGESNVLNRFGDKMSEFKKSLGFDKFFNP